MAIRVGAQLWPEHAEYRQLRAAWLRAEELGVDTLWNRARTPAGIDQEIHALLVTYQVLRTPNGRRHQQAAP